MNRDSNAIAVLCSHLCVGKGMVPLEPKEWGLLAKRLNDADLVPGDLFDLSKDELIGKAGLSSELSERILRLIDRNASLSFEIDRYESMGISIVTRADTAYPSKLRKTLRNNCPPLFYCAGNMSLPDKAYIGYVGSRTVSEDDVLFTKKTVRKTVAQGYGVVSGGARGIDAASEEEALGMGASVVEYLSDSMLRKMKRSSIIKAVNGGSLLLLSVVNPDAGFNIGSAMMRNRYIYAQSSGTVVVRSDYNKGGTWSGAMENLKHNWCKELCRDKQSYPGNKALIENGAIPIDESWDGDIDSLKAAPEFSKPEQLSLFDD